MKIYLLTKFRHRGSTVTYYSTLTEIPEGRLAWMGFTPSPPPADSNIIIHKKHHWIHVYPTIEELAEITGLPAEAPEYVLLDRTREMLYE